MKGLTKRQREIVDYIENFLTLKKYTPSYREIQQHFGFASLGTVFNHIKSLKKKGILQANRQNSRSLALVSDLIKMDQIELPLIGQLKGGMPIETYAQITMLSLPASMVASGEPSYLLKVVGRELEEEYVQEGDLLVLQSKTKFQDKDMVLAQVSGQTTFVKRAIYDPPYMRLESTNPEVQPLILREDHVHILGVITGLIRNY
jgi:repressor LexA